MCVFLESGNSEAGQILCAFLNAWAVKTRLINGMQVRRGLGLSDVYLITVHYVATTVHDAVLSLTINL